MKNYISYYDMPTEEMKLRVNAFVKKIPNACNWIANFTDNKLEVFFDGIHSKTFKLSEVLGTLD